MKSTVMPTVVIAAASALTIIGMLSLSLSHQSNIVLRGANERTIIEASNEMEFVKKALHQSLIYSTYQSSYETLKHGGYSTEGCKPEKFDDIPYLRTMDNICPPKNLDETLTQNLKSNFNEYLSALRTKAEKINIQIPDYKSVTLETENNKITINAQSDGRIKFLSRNLELYDNPDVKEILKLRITDLVNKAMKIFGNKDKDPIKDQIELSENQMTALTIDEVLFNGKLTGNCKSNKFEICVHPDVAYELPSKSSLLPNNCETDFVKNVVKNINSLDYNEPSIEVSLETKQEIIKSSVDTTDEATCSNNKIPNYYDGTKCDCVKWVCGISNPVVVGDEQRFRVYAEQIVESDAKCSPCISILPGDPLLEESYLCGQYTSKVCPTINPDEWDNRCWRTQQCTTSETCDISEGCMPSETETEGSFCWYDPQPKQCPSGTKEFGSTGRCYATPQTSPTCSLRKTLYTKTCAYDYLAEADVLVTVTDTENKYPVYDKNEQKTDLRNLKLQFYVLSKN